MPSNAGGGGLILDWGAKIPHASQSENRNMKQKQYCNKFNKDFQIWFTLKKNLERKAFKFCFMEGSCTELDVRENLKFLLLHPFLSGTTSY